MSRIGAFSKPVIVVSRCLGFESCRYDGSIINDHFVTSLQPYVEIKTICPEAEIGLGTPRNPIRLVNKGEKGICLVQPATGLDLTQQMERFAEKFIQNETEEVDGYILKSRSPSCGIKDVKVYSELEKTPPLSTSIGIFSQAVTKHHEHLAIEEEGRLKNYLIRENFLIKLFTLASFREKKKLATIQTLINFQSKNKYLFMAINQQKQKELGRIIANQPNRPLEDVFYNYEKALNELLKHPRTLKSNINVMHHLMGYFSDQLHSEEKTFILSLIEKYRNKKVPLGNPLMVLKSWAVRFNVDYLLKQTFFQPYPEQLQEITDSGKGRNY